jgi:DNA-binding NarL/FixJ family response regulator
MTMLRPEDFVPGGSVDKPDRPDIPRREIVTLLAYLEAGSHKGAAWKLGISESTSRQRISQLMRRVGARNVAQAVWALGASLQRGPRP